MTGRRFGPADPGPAGGEIAGPIGSARDQREEPVTAGDVGAEPVSSRDHDAEPVLPQDDGEEPGEIASTPRPELDAAAPEPGEIPVTPGPEPAAPAPPVDDPEGADRPDARVEASDGSRPTELRLASLHLRMGQLALARAELEALDRRGVLDDAGLADLAEARWRSDDLAQAGEAADGLVRRGTTNPVVLAIAAEAIAAAGRPTEARRLVTMVLESPDVSLEALFAGMPRHSIWPDPGPDPVAAVSGAAAHRVTTPVAGGAPGRGTAGGDMAASAWLVSGAEPGPPSAAEPGRVSAAEAYAGGRAALAAGDAGTAAVRLGVALRLDPAFAPEVLAAVGDGPAEPELALLAGDALRILGREREALLSFDVARRGPGAADHPPAEPEPAQAVTAGGEAGSPASAVDEATADEPMSIDTHDGGQQGGTG